MTESQRPAATHPRLKESRDKYVGQDLRRPPGNVPPVLRKQWAKVAAQLLEERPGITASELYREVCRQIDGLEMRQPPAAAECAPACKEGGGDPLFAHLMGGQQSDTGGGLIARRGRAGA